MTNPLISEGSPAPDLTLAADGGRRGSLAEHRGRPVVLYFYPKDDTPGCTREACGFRDGHDRIARAGAVVLGVSPDSASRHDAFKKKYDLDFTLLADPDHAAARAWGVWRAKKSYGRETEGIVRSTFLIDSGGIVRRVWDSVKVDGHVDEVLAALEAL